MPHRVRSFSASLLGAVLVLSNSACRTRGTLSCETSEDCSQAGIRGTCRSSPLSEQLWCGFPDPECPPPSERWGILTGEGLAGECVPAESADAGLLDGGTDAGEADAAPPVDFAFAFGGVGDDNVIGVTTVANGAVYVGGSFSGSLTIGTETLVSNGQTDLYVARFRIDGSVDWAKSFGGAGQDLTAAIGSDADGALLLAGSFSGSVDFGAGPLVASGPSDIVLLKLSSTGAFIWARDYGASSAEEPLAMATGESGDLFVTGRFSGTTDLGSGLLTSAGSNDIFLARYSGLDGTEQWSQKLGGTGDEIAIAIDVRGANVAITGVFSGPTNLGGGTTMNAAGGFAAVYSAAAGIYGWSRLTHILDAFSPVKPKGIRLADDGGAYMSGDFSGSTDFGSGVVMSAGLGDDFVVRYAASGALTWLRQVGGTQQDGGGVLAITDDGDVVVSGTFKSTVDFGVRSITAAGADVFMMKISPSNTPLEALSFGNAGDEAVTALAGGDVTVMVGGFSGTMNAGDVNLTRAGGTDVFVIGRVLP